MEYSLLDDNLVQRLEKLEERKQNNRSYCLGFLLIGTVITTFSFCIWSTLKGCDPSPGGACSSWQILTDVYETDRHVFVDGGVSITTDWRYKYNDGTIRNYVCVFASSSDAFPITNETNRIGIILNYAPGATKMSTECLWKQDDLKRSKQIAMACLILWLLALPVSTIVTCIFFNIEEAKNRNFRESVHHTRIEV